MFGNNLARSPPTITTDVFGNTSVIIHDNLVSSVWCSTVVLQKIRHFCCTLTSTSDCAAWQSSIRNSKSDVELIIANTQHRRLFVRRLCSSVCPWINGCVGKHIHWTFQIRTECCLLGMVLRPAFVTPVFKFALFFRSIFGVTDSTAIRLKTALMNYEPFFVVFISGLENAISADCFGVSPD